MGIRTRRARTHSRTHFVGFGLAGIIGFIALSSIALAMSFDSLVDSWLKDLPDYTAADAYLAPDPTEIYDCKGNIIAELCLENRKTIPREAVSEYILKGTVATEDIRFYQHSGVDPIGIMRALVVSVSGGAEGASTITQQLVRNTVLKNERFNRTIKRKVREAYIAIAMEKTYTKEQILMMYLNTIYYGHNAYGIESAAETYFSKHASELTLAEAATLIGIPNSPTQYDPTINPELCKKRRNIVLNRMLSAHNITQEQHDAAQAEDIVLKLSNIQHNQRGTYPYFTDYIKTLLQEDFSNDAVFKGGLKIYTTLDPDQQAAAEKAVADQLKQTGNDRLDCGMVAVEPSTGHIKALVGGRDYDTSQYNLATSARRQVGSTFKPITLATAINAGVNPNIYINCNSPQRINKSWKVQNYANASYGAITLARATELSSNVAYAKIANTLGAEPIVSTAKSMGIKVDLPNYPSITLGTVGIPPVQMAEAYATFASGGVHRDAVAITKIVGPNSNTIYEHKDHPTQAMSTAIAADVTRVLERTLSRGTATLSPVAPNVDQPLAGKTGTTEKSRDIWFCGYSPQISVAVWCGYREEAPIRIGGSEGHPYSAPTPIFMRFVNATLKDQARQEFITAEKPVYKPNSEWNFSTEAAQGSSSQNAVQSRPRNTQRAEAPNETSNHASNNETTNSAQPHPSPTSEDNRSTPPPPNNQVAASPEGNQPQPENPSQTQAN